jgi:hypothetical protein
MLKAAAREAHEETEVLYNESGIKQLDPSLFESSNSPFINERHSGHPLATPLAQFSRIHPVNAQGKQVCIRQNKPSVNSPIFPFQFVQQLSQYAYVSVALSRRLRQMAALSDAEELASPSLAIHIQNGTALGRDCPPPSAPACAGSPFRSLSGQCNNVRHPLFGSAGEPMGRLAPPAYADGLSQPRRNIRGDGELPPVRQISLELFQNPREENSGGVGEIAAYWMYFIGSDMANLAPSQCLVKGIK